MIVLWIYVAWVMLWALVGCLANKRGAIVVSIGGAIVTPLMLVLMLCFTLVSPLILLFSKEFRDIFFEKV